jgi:hypothetical protein
LLVSLQFFMSESTPAVFSGPVNSKSLKPWLISLATSLSLSPEGTNPKLVERINGHFRAHPELYEEPRYQGIVSYRPPKTAKSKKPAKTSADKDQEDAMEADKAKEVRGCVRVCLENFRVADYASQGSKDTSEPWFVC